MKGIAVGAGELQEEEAREFAETQEELKKVKEELQDVRSENQTLRRRLAIPDSD